MKVVRFMKTNNPIMAISIRNKSNSQVFHLKTVTQQKFIHYPQGYSMSFA